MLTDLFSHIIKYIRSLKPVLPQTLFLVFIPNQILSPFIFPIGMAD